MAIAKRYPPLVREVGIKPEPLLAKALCDGMVAGMLADHCLGRREAAYESALRPHLLGVAHKRGFGAFLEYPLERDREVRGARPKLDALLYYGRQLVAIEIKTLRPSGVRLDIVGDVDKLRRFLAGVQRHKDALASESIPRKGKRKEIRRVTAWQFVAWTEGETWQVDPNRDGEGFRQVRLACERAGIDFTISQSGGGTFPGRGLDGNVQVFSVGSVGGLKASCLALRIR